MNDCIFCNLAKGEIPSEILYQDENFLVFRDINPAAPVHVLIIPREHISSLNEVKNFALIGSMFELAVKIAQELKIAETGYRTIINTGENGGQTVKHLHMHLLGSRNMGWPPG